MRLPVINVSHCDFSPIQVSYLQSDSSFLGGWHFQTNEMNQLKYNT